MSGSEAVFYRYSHQLPMDKVISYDWSNTLDFVLAGNFSSYTYLQNDELFLYDGGSGYAFIYQTDGNGNINVLNNGQWIGSQWNIITTGNFLPTGFQQILLLYEDGGNSHNSEISFKQVWQNGWMSSVGPIYSTASGWDIISVGNYSTTFIDAPEIIFYDKKTGNMEIRTTGLSPNRFKKIVDIQEEKYWSSIVFVRDPINWSRDYIFFYNKDKGFAKLIAADSSNNYQPKLIREYNVIKKCDIVLGTRGGITNEPGLLFYNSETGKATRYYINNYNLSLDLVKFQEDVFSKYLKTIVSGRFFGSGQLVTEPQDLLTYGVQNKAIYLPWEGYIDTNQDFSTFFDKDHWIECWFMPQFVHMDRQPIIAENGSGKYMIGMGDYSEGNVIYNKDYGEQYNRVGNPVIYIQVGDEERIYLVPEFEERTWHHIALARNGNTFQLYINGGHKYPVEIKNHTINEIDSNGQAHTVVDNKSIKPDTEITLTSPAFSNKPSGTLRFGRRTSGTSNDQAQWQAYGLLDEVAIFRGSLDPSKLEKAKGRKRLNGRESGLAAYWSFDFPVSVINGVYQSWMPSTNEKGNPIPVIVSVSGGRNSQIDSKLFDQPFLLNTHIVVNLPVKSGEEWHVNQGMNSELWSHMGSSAFCYDLGMNVNTGDYPNGTAYAPLFCPKNGIVIRYKKDNDSTPRESNNILLKISKTQVFGYLHLAKNTFNGKIQGGSLQDPDGVSSSGDEYFTFDDSNAPELSLGEVVAKIGPNAKHLHCSGRSEIGNYVDNLSHTTPLAFRNYMVRNINTGQWQHVEVGFPKVGDVIRAL